MQAVDRVEELKASFRAGRPERAARFAERMAAARADAPEGDIELAPVEMTGWDLLMRGEDDLLGAKVRRKPDPAAPFCERPKGYVVHFDEEGVRIMVFGNRYGKLSVLSEDVIPFSEVDPAETVPGGTHARHKVARMIYSIIGIDHERGLIGDYERRLSGFANSLCAPNVPVRRK